MSLWVIAPGPRTIVTDGGRPGLAGLGVGPSGAADRGSHDLANRLLGNPPSAATLEVLGGGLEVEAREGTLLAVTGAPVPLRVGGRPAPLAAPVYVAAGQRLALGRPEGGLRSYVGVLGGIGAPEVLGSRSYDSLAHLGPPPLAPGDELLVDGAMVSGDTAICGLALGGAPGRAGAAGAELATSAYRGPTGAPGSGPDSVLAATWGPRADWFTPQAREALARGRWVVGADSDRVGVRCSGPRLDRALDGELPSEPVVRGSVQVPASGQPVLFLADHPTTGGYPVIAVLDGPATDLLAQLRPGDGVRIEVRSVPYATDLAV